MIKLPKKVMQDARKKALECLVKSGLYLPGKRSILDETAIKRAGGMRYKYFKYVGARAWLIRGKKKDILIWDNGNGWCQIMSEVDRNAKSKNKR